MNINGLRRNAPSSGSIEELQRLLADARDIVARLENELAAKCGGNGFAHPIVVWRRRRGLTQADLARLVGITPPALCRIERTPGFAARETTRSGISKVLNVPQKWLYAGGGVSQNHARRRRRPRMPDGLNSPH